MQPCIGQTLEFDFFNGELAYSNLGGQGPDSTRPSAIRYSNVGVTSLPGSTQTTRFDLVLVATSAYTPSDPSLNGINGRFAQVNVLSNTQVTLRVGVFISCCEVPNCAACERLGTPSERSECYELGCCCFGQELSYCPSGDCC